MPSRRPWIVLLALVAGCAHRPPPAASPATPSAATRPSYPLPVEPNGVWWDAGGQQLWFASDEEHAVYRWHDGVAALAGTLPSSPGKPGLGQLVVTADGRVVVTRFGHGDSGGVLVMGRDGVALPVAGLDVTRRRIGLAVATDGMLYDGYFVYDQASHTSRGAVARLSLDAGGETDVLTGLAKPVGVLVVGDALYVSDQAANVILRAPLSTPADARPFAELLEPDLLCAGSHGVLYAASKKGSVYRVAPDGHVEQLAGGFRPLRGIAYDAGGKRLFVVERRSHAPEAPPTLHVLLQP